MDVKVVTTNARIHGLTMWLVAAALVAAGYWLSANRVLDEEWIGRAGCLIVVLGIWSGFGGLVQERLMLNGLRLRREVTIRAIRRRFWRDPEDCDARIEKAKQSFDERAEKLRHELTLSVGLLEVSLLITGTLLWGFGDLARHVL